MNRNLIVQLHYGHPNDFESVAYARRSWAALGYDLVDIALTDPQIQAKLGSLLQQRSAEIFCFMSGNYWGTKVRNNGQLLHQFTGIPFVILMHDHPLYFLDEQIPELNGTFIFPPGEELVDFITKHYPIDVTVVPRYGAAPAYDAGPPAYENFVARRNVMLAPINLNVGPNTMDGFWQQIKALPPARRAATKRLAEAAVAECRVPLHVIAEGLPALPDPADAAAALKDQALVLNFAKLWRRNKLVRTLIDLPVLISTEFVPADLELRYPGKFTLFSRAQTIPMYREYRFTLNSNPLLTTVLHERVLEPLFANSVCVSDRNVVLERYFADGREIVYYDYDDERSADKIARYFDDPEAAFALTASAYAVRIASDNLHLLEPYRNLIAAIEQRWRDVEPAAAGAAARA